MSTLTLLANQDVKFDPHERGSGQEAKRENLHFHKRMKDNAKHRTASAEVLIYLDKSSAEWVTKGKGGGALEKELKSVFAKQNTKEIEKFVSEVYRRVQLYGKAPTSDEQKSEIRDGIIRAFYGDERLEIISSQIDKLFNSRYSMTYIPIDQRFIQTTFNEKNKTITFKDKSIRKNNE